MEDQNRDNADTQNHHNTLSVLFYANSNHFKTEHRKTYETNLTDEQYKQAFGVSKEEVKNFKHLMKEEWDNLSNECSQTIFFHKNQNI